MLNIPTITRIINFLRFLLLTLIITSVLFIVLSKIGLI
uniref:Cytochrome b6/f complex subunit VI n=4 Tax=Opuntioideae TaxID=186267 RepID=A0A6M5A2M6_OPUQU|nr:cytochrome b6/f subunit L [Brasiliopuntia brasiliensis]YP_010965221.1 cytochrome b6/f subunit L [Consolea macracantha]YP_010965307.1 cytochrome b6/f subunit L [Consolea moniliformis]YP_010965393.1 cytochrome b6/f subunit L [Consolea rubescens]YP_010965483.1 cytochrome b6/f subunit L [Miqueliopuntia miquelii]YP_010965565.1 cytochrome b6/f subunit L [Opuntia arechavaletae]YP_010965647.1 cytochrome b6/f subunit L [Opuntia auberi]YP_010965726.1 cytochrome b6/f subunit L [Opuntia aureispina]Y